MSLAALLVGCNTSSAPESYVARVNDTYLTAEMIDARLALLSDENTDDARQQVIEQWVTNQLLRQEAKRLDLQNDPGIRRQLEDSEQSILANALMQRLYTEESVTWGMEEKRAYFERNKHLLKLREPYVRVRYLEVNNESEAETARGMLVQLREENAATDSLWSIALNTFALDTQGSRDLSESFFPERQLFWDRPPVRQALARLRDSRVSPIVPYDSTFHVIQLIERKPVGTIPEFAWVEDEITERVSIQARKQLFARQVQRLRNEALSRDDLEIRQE